MRLSMNHDTLETTEEILKKCGVAVLCPVDGSNYIAAQDAGAGKMAYAMATNALKSGERGFRGMSRENVIDLG